MFDTYLKSTGREYTTTVALLVVAFIFIPALLFVSRPFGYLFLSFGISSSALCLALAWVSWRKFSQVSVPSISIQRTKAK